MHVNPEVQTQDVHA